MEPVLKGWLTKSPPEKKSSGHWNLFGAKWKKRFFVLYAPPMGAGMAEKRVAMLEYYTGKKLNTKVGFINLDDCDEILSNLDSDTYKNVFSLHTKHKGRDRTYYLVADTEEEMNSWVMQLCRVLGLLENDENKLAFSPENRQFKSFNATTPRPIPNYQSHPNRLVSPGSSVPNPLLGNRLNSSEPNLLDKGRFAHDQRPRSNMPDFISNYHSNSNEMIDNTARLKLATSVPDIDFIQANMSSVPFVTNIKPREKTELPPIPPEKTKKSMENMTILEELDGSTKPDAVSSDELLLQMTAKNDEIPPPKPPKEKKVVLSGSKYSHDIGDGSDIAPLPPKSSKSKESLNNALISNKFLHNNNNNNNNNNNYNDDSSHNIVNNSEQDNYNVPKVLEDSYDSPKHAKNNLTEDEDSDNEIVYNTPKSMFSDSKAETQQQHIHCNEKGPQSKHDDGNHHDQQHFHEKQRPKNNAPTPASRKSIINKNYKPSTYSMAKDIVDVSGSGKSNNDSAEFYEVPKKNYTNVTEPAVSGDLRPVSKESIDLYDVPPTTKNKQQQQQQPHQSPNIEEMYDAPKNLAATSPPTQSHIVTGPPLFKPVPARRTRVNPQDGKQDVTRKESNKPVIKAKPSLVGKNSTKLVPKQQPSTTATTSSTTSSSIIITTANNSSSINAQTVTSVLTTTLTITTITSSSSTSSTTTSSSSQLPPSSSTPTSTTTTTTKSSAAMKSAYQKKVKGPTTTLIHESIRFTHRSKSFKRSITGQDVENINLPVKRSDASSSSDNSDVDDG